MEDIQGPAPNRSTRGTRTVSRLTEWLGSVPAVVAAALLMLLWLVGSLAVPRGTGNDRYALLLNTVTAIVTFVMVFIIQSSQNRDSRAMQAKLDAQNRALLAIAQRLDVDGLKELLDSMALEEAPEGQIAHLQQRVHRRG